MLSGIIFVNRNGCAESLWLSQDAVQPLEAVG